MISQTEKKITREQNRLGLCVRTESRRANDESLPPFCLVINRRAERESRANYNMNEVAKNYILADGFFCNGDVILPDADWKSDALAQQLSILITSFFGTHGADKK
jgi:hypothetical protein